MQNSFTLSQRAFSRCFPRLEEDTVMLMLMRRITMMYTRLGGKWASSNSFLDEALAVLLVFICPTPPTLSTLPSSPFPSSPVSSSHSPSSSLYPSSSSRSSSSIEPLLPPLLTLLPALASAHPHPFIRLSAFRLLGLVIRAAPRVLRVQVLVDLVGGGGDNSGDCARSSASSQSRSRSTRSIQSTQSTQTQSTQTQMVRIATIGLLKDLLLDTLSTTRGSNSILASPRDVDSRTRTRTDSEKRGEREMELTRLAEVLVLYYILEMRDVGNRTGVRDPDNRDNIKRTLIAPIRSCGVELDAFLHTPPDALDTSFILNALHNALLHILLNTPDPIVE
ncbi:hypothetical protein F5051DRAFT_445432 [Lentinula edodes]|nr:hypothetical protein F5051DRAFT_445432 [Lentinula edodes]